MGRGSQRTGYVIRRLSSSAKTFLKQHRDEDTRLRVSEAFDIITPSPFHYQKRIRSLKGKPKGEYRYRFGGIRIHYFVDRERRAIDILNIDTRGDIVY